MLKINNNFKKYRIPLITMAIVASGIFLFQYLTFIPEYSSAEEISTPVYDETKVDTRTLSDITYMQEMTSEICERSVENETKQLIDNRDLKLYWITKLKDKNCWMTQNIALDPSIRPLTPNDSNVRETWTAVSKWDITKDTVAWRIVGANTGHNSYGGYYSWQAATAATAPADTGEALGSICAKGWRLPRGDENIIVNSFSKLTSSYSISNNTSGLNILIAAPLYFVKGGVIYNGWDNDTGNSGNYWSSTASDEASAYSLSFNSGGVISSAISERHLGFSVRCLNDPDVKNDLVNPEIDNPNVSVTVDKILTMELSNKEVDIEPKTNEIMTGNFTATVSSNAGYDISLSATEGSQTAMIDSKSATFNIPATNNVEVGTNGWGIKCVDDENCILKSYNALTLYNNPQVYFSSTNAATNKTTYFEVGISTSPSLPSGTYSTNILVTASQK